MITDPYPGLRPFERDEDTLFFGRDEQVDQLLDKLAETHFLAVLGTSGSGKSSLVRAGLLPALDSGYLAGAGARWAVAELRPGDQPFRRLAAGLIENTDWGKAQVEVPDASADSDTDAAGDAATDQAITELEADLRRGSLALNWRLGVRPLPEGTRLLILVDQFEELFRYHRDAEHDAAAFVALLLGAATHPDVYLVITLRSEFLGDCALYPDLPEAINAGLFLTPSLTPEQMADAIQLPAQLPQFDGEVEPDLVRTLLAEVRGQSDQLPLLQHALMRLWDRAGSTKRVGAAKRLDSAGLEALGGLSQCLDAHVEEAYASLNPEQKRIAEALFRGLTERSSGARDTRRPVRLDEIAALAGVDPAAVVAVVEVFREPGRSFLMPSVGTPLTPDSVLDITHEALIRQWRRLQQWTEDEAEQVDLYQRLASAARRHAQGGGALWIDPDLQIALNWRNERQPTADWAARYGGDFARAMRFLDTSRESRDTARKAEVERHHKEIRLTRAVALVSVVAFLVSAVLAGWALYERFKALEAQQEANRQAQLAEAREKRAKTAEQERTESLFDSGLTHAALLARVEDPAEARSVLRETVKLDNAIAAPRRHARNLLAGYVDILGGTADKSYEGANAALVGGVTVSPDGRLLAAAGERGTLVLFDSQTGELLRRLEGHYSSASSLGSVPAIVFAPDGDVLYSGGYDRRIIRWSVPEGVKLGEWQAPSEVWTLALTSDGKTLASGGKDDIITLWSTATGEKRRSLKGKSSSIAYSNSLAFFQDGRLLVSGSYRRDVGIWDLESGTERVLPQLHTDRVYAVAVSSDGTLIATGGGDKRIVLWEAASGRPLRLLRGHGNLVFGLAFGAAGRRLLSVSRDSSMRLWDVETGVTLRIYQGHSADLWSVTRHGEIIYTAAGDVTVRRWSMATPGQWMWDMPGTPNSVAVHPDGGFVTVGFEDGALRVYTLPDTEGLPGKPLVEVEDAHKTNVKRQAFSPSSNLLATAIFDSTVKLWRIEHTATGPALTLLRTLKDHRDAVHAVAFSPDGRTLASASYDGQVGLFDVESGESRLFDSAATGQVLAVEFDPTGNQLMSVNGDNRVIRFWDINSDLQQPAAELPKLADTPLWATFSPDGRQLAAVGRGSRVTLHDLGPTAVPPQWLVGHENAVYRAIYSPDGALLATVSTDMTVRLWDLTTGKILFVLRLPTENRHPSPLWDFDFRCLPDGHCWIAVPLTMGRLALYRLPYEHPPASLKQ